MELSNLHRQFLYQEHDVGRAKVEVVTARLSELNTDILIEPYQVRLDAKNVASIVAPYDIILDGCDSFNTRFLLNQECVKQCKPLFSGAVSEWSGQVGVFLGYKKQQPCYQCFCPSIPPENNRKDCSVGGVMGALTSAIGSHMAMQAIKYIAQIGKDSEGELLRYDALKGSFSRSKILKDDHCPTCAE